MYKGNTQKVMADAKSIVKRLKETDATLGTLQKEYRCGYETIMMAILSRISKAQYRRLAKKKLAKGGIKTRFKKGYCTYRMPKGTHNSPATEFKKGHLPATHKHTGTITIRNDKCGKQFRWIKVSGILQGSHKWIPYARYLWEKKNGPVPAGYFVIHKNGKTLDDREDNLRLVDRRRHLALQKKRNPGWKKKAIRTYKRTVRKRRKLKEQAEKVAAKSIQSEHINQQQKAEIKAEIKKLKGSIVSWWECNGCGHESNAEIPPTPCPKCNSLHYEKIRQRTSKVG